MVKTASELKNSVDRFVEALRPDVEVETLLLSGDYAAGCPTEDSDIDLLVVSPSFEGKNLPERIDILGAVSVRIDPLIQAWGYTPTELADQRAGTAYIPLLGMQLHGGTKVIAGGATREPKRPFRKQGGEPDD